MSHLPADMEYWNDSWITSYYWYYFTNAVLWRISSLLSYMFAMGIIIDIDYQNKLRDVKHKQY